MNLKQMKRIAFLFLFCVGIVAASVVPADALTGCPSGCSCYGGNWGGGPSLIVDCQEYSDCTAILDCGNIEAFCSGFCGDLTQAGRSCDDFYCAAECDCWGAVN
jgi:hypothetical protein